MDLVTCDYDVVQDAREMLQIFQQKAEEEKKKKKVGTLRDGIL